MRSTHFAPSIDRTWNVLGRCALGAALVLTACDEQADEAAQPAVREPSAELGLGAEGPEVVEAHAYLHRFGYFPNPELAAHYPGWTPIVDVAPEDPELFDDTLEEALSLFQSNNGLPVTGLLDGPTRALMQQPRCGVPDAYVPPRSAFAADQRRAPQADRAARSLDDFAHPHDPTAYTPSGLSWPYTELSYGFGTASVDSAAAFQRQAVIAAMNTWSAAAPIAWVERTNPDVLVSFVTRVHGDGNDFPTSTYAHAYYPSCSTATGAFNCAALSGDVHFNDETYAWGAGNGFLVQDVESIALHELGHTLGLDHSADPTAVMYPTMPSGLVRHSLSPDDLNGIRAIYPHYRDLRSFHPEWYLHLNPDLVTVFGWGGNAGSFHWLSSGRNEGRLGSPAFDVRYYLQNNPDLAQAFGPTGYLAAMWHWRDSGLTEGRRSSPAFDPKYYLNRYADLRGAYGSTNYSAGLVHWLESGLGEGRRASPNFDPVYYMQANPDVAQQYGATHYKAAALHWLTVGIAQGRKGAP